MLYTITGLLMLAIGGGILLIASGIWAKAFAGAIFISGFIIFGLDLMRRSINKPD